MPRYTLDPLKDTDKVLIDEDQMLKMYNKCRNDLERLLLCIAWITGARTLEILTMHRGDVAWDDDLIIMRILTEKLRGPMKGSKREIIFKRIMGHQDQLYLDTIIQIARKTQDPARWLFPSGHRNCNNHRPTNWARKIVKRIGLEACQLPYCIHHFRHTVLTHLGSSGMGIKEMQAFKGSAGANSVLPYLHPKETVIDYSKVSKTRWLGARLRPQVNAFNSEPERQRIELAVKPEDTLPPGVKEALEREAGMSMELTTLKPEMDDKPLEIPACMPRPLPEPSLQDLKAELERIKKMLENKIQADEPKIV